MKIKYIACNTHEWIKISDELIQDVISTKEFQRLGRIRQLGLTNMLFPTATHTRLAHSLGVYELARRVLENLFPHGMDEFLKRAILLSGLIHDIGHGPLSHLFEKFSPIKHEEYTLKILNSDDTEMNKIISKYDKNLIPEITKIIKGKHKYQWVNQLISSEIDLDRLDYLIRDSLNTGTNYGNLNVGWIIKNMKIKDNILVFKEATISTIESFVLGRYHMNISVYKKPKNLGYQSLFDFFMNRLIYLNKNKDLKNDYGILQKVFKNEILETNEFHGLDDETIFCAMKNALTEKDEILVNLTTSLLDNKIPIIYTLKSDLEKLKIDNKTSEKEMVWDIINMVVDFSSYGTDAKNEAKILTEEGKIVSLKELSTIIGHTMNNKQKIKELGIKIKWNK